MPSLKRLGEDVLVKVFQSASAGKPRLPLRRALSELASLFYGDEKPLNTSEEFMNEFYLRGLDVRCGLRSQVLMVGGPKNIRGNPRGGLDARLFYPCVTREQFIMIGRAMEGAFLERKIPQLSSGRLRAERTTSEVQDLENRRTREQLQLARSMLSKH